MGKYFAYARVSTPRQGEKGVSLPEQKEAIERYARAHGLEIIRWFEERESASQKGRPTFTEMLRLLRRGTVQGVIIHKIDRSARNLEDWADVGKLVDAGVEVHFATENLTCERSPGVSRPISRPSSQRTIAAISGKRSRKGSTGD